jgi:UDP-N-acetylmuramate: L-alanyl-gamma-D-glutamyl-meso-diaminopimelate ligase
MSAAAALMKEKGCRVTGSDSAVYSPISDFLEREGITFDSSFDASSLCSPPDLVVIGNSVSRGNPEVEEVLEKRIPYVSLPGLLRDELIQGKRSLVVTGTHGKTTSTSLLAWILACNKRDPSFFVGGIPRNFGRGIRHGKGDEVVLEGDEYDTAFFDKRSKFLHYLPDRVIVNNIEYDHADIFNNVTEIEKAFENLLKLVPRTGLVVANIDEPAVRRLLIRSFCPVEWFGMSEEAIWRVSEMEPEEEGIAFSLCHNNRLLGRLHFPLMGVHNALNAAAVYVTCQGLGLTHREIQQGFETFQGVSRRMEKLGTFRGVTVIDDFAHHPTAITKTLDAVRFHHPGQRIWAVFEPRSHTSRRNTFQTEMGRALQRASEVIIGAVYGEAAIDSSQRLDPTRLVQDIQTGSTTKAHHISNVDAAVTFLSSHLRDREIVVVMSSGSFGGLTTKLIEQLERDAEGY